MVHIKHLKQSTDCQVSQQMSAVSSKLTTSIALNSIIPKALLNLPLSSSLQFMLLSSLLLSLMYVLLVVLVGARHCTRNQRFKDA